MNPPGRDVGASAPASTRAVGILRRMVDNPAGDCSWVAGVGRKEGERVALEEAAVKKAQRPTAKHRRERGDGACWCP